ncbi:MAG TPA: hypothetical protein PKV44_05370 [Bacillota bacterium]|nr:hypothetical protein [Bacillota bacterium]HPE38911.1 hypothetical protein [Bacillota bacterium]
MNKEKIIELLRKSMSDKMPIRIYYHNDPNAYDMMVVGLSSQELFVAREVKDFDVDGYIVLRTKDIKQISLCEPMLAEILKNEGILNEISSIDESFSTWNDVVAFFIRSKKNVILEIENRNSGAIDFAVGRLAAVDDRYVTVAEFDAEGNWLADMSRFPLSGIRSVTFDSRYVTIFSKYLGSCPLD